MLGHIQRLILENCEYNPDTGQIRIMRKDKRRFGKWLDGYSIKNGYYNVRVKGLDIPVHRAGWLLHYGTLPTEPNVIDHINHIKSDNRIKNLQILTRADNTAKRLMTGAQWLREQGRLLEKHPQITEDDIKSLKAKKEATKRMEALALRKYENKQRIKGYKINNPDRFKAA